MKSWEVLFKQAPRNDDGGQGDSTADDIDDIDDAADDALVEEGEAELEEGDDDEEADPEEEEEQSDEDQDPDAEEEEEEEEAEEEEEEEEEPASGFKFRNPKTGDFDFARINKAVGGPELEKAFKEQTATITRTSQEVSRLKSELSSPQLRDSRQKGAFLDRMMDENPVIRAEVQRVLHGGNGGQGQQASSGSVDLQGFDPADPALPILKNLLGKVQTFENQQAKERRQQEVQEYERNFETGLRSAAASFKKQVGRDANREELDAIAKEMEETGDLRGDRFVSSLFLQDILKAERQRAIKDRKFKRKLPKAPSGRRVVPTKKRRSREEDQDDLWEQHIENGGDDE